MRRNVGKHLVDTRRSLESWVVERVVADLEQCTIENLERWVFDIGSEESSLAGRWRVEVVAKMSSNGEFSTMSSEEVPSLPKSLPSSREATAEGSSGSSGGYMPLREFLDRFSLPRVVRLEGTGGRPVLLYKQQQRSLRVTATLLIHRYRHDVKVGPEIVIPEGYPGELSFF